MPENSPAGQPGPEAPSVLRSGAAFAGMGMGAASTVGVCTALGYLADEHLGTAPWLLLAGIAIGLCGAVASVIALIKRFL